ncbi:hypothetical protein D3C86_1753840 [compost metagenome]
MLFQMEIITPGMWIALLIHSYNTQHLSQRSWLAISITTTPHRQIKLREVYSDGVWADMVHYISVLPIPRSFPLSEAPVVPLTLIALGKDIKATK